MAFRPVLYKFAAILSLPSCGSNKYPYLPYGKKLEGGGVFKTIEPFTGECEAKLEFPDGLGRGGSNQTICRVGSMNIF